MANKVKSRLGRGLSSLLQTPVAVEVKHAIASTEPRATESVTGPTVQANPAVPPKAKPIAGSAAVERDAELGPEAGLRQIPVGTLVPSRFQPRREMDAPGLERLAASIRSAGVMQPIAVRPLPAGDARAAVGGLWEIVAGERRWRAAQIAGLKTVPAVVSDLDDRGAAEWGVVENLQREDLNTMDRAWGVRNLADSFGLSHTEIAEKVGLDRSSVSNLVRLTELEPGIQELLRTGALGLGHGKALLAHAAGATREKLAKLAVSQEWSVRRLERAGSALQSGVGSSGPGLGGHATDATGADSAVRELERQLGEHLGTRVRIVAGASRAKGKVVLDFYSLEHFDGLMQLIGFDLKS